MDGKGKRQKHVVMRHKKGQQGEGSSKRRPRSPTPSPSPPHSPPAHFRDVSGKKIHRERPIVMEILQDSAIPGWIFFRHWVKLATSTFPVNENVVREFFERARVEDLEQGVPVRGKRVLITPSIINDFLEIRTRQTVETFDVRTDEFSFEHIEFLKSRIHIPPRTGPSFVQYAELDPDPAFMLMWSRFSLIPVVSANKISHEEVQFLLCLLKGWPMNTGGILYSVICKNLQSLDRQTAKATRYLFLPGLVCALCDLAGVPTYPDDHIMPPEKKLDSFAWNHMMQSRGGRANNAKRQQDSHAPSSSDPLPSQETLDGLLQSHFDNLMEWLSVKFDTIDEEFRWHSRNINAINSGVAELRAEFNRFRVSSQQPTSTPAHTSPPQSPTDLPSSSRARPSSSRRGHQ